MPGGKTWKGCEHPCSHYQVSAGAARGCLSLVRMLLSPPLPHCTLGTFCSGPKLTYCFTLIPPATFSQSPTIPSCHGQGAPQGFRLQESFARSHGLRCRQEPLKRPRWKMTMKEQIPLCWAPGTLGYVISLVLGKKAQMKRKRRYLLFDYLFEICHSLDLESKFWFFSILNCLTGHCPWRFWTRISPWQTGLYHRMVKSSVKILFGCSLSFWLSMLNGMALHDSAPNFPAHYPASEQGTEWCWVTFRKLGIRKPFLGLCVQLCSLRALSFRLSQGKWAISFDIGYPKIFYSVGTEAQIWATISPTES